MRAVPQLMFQGDMEGALALWRRAFPDMVLRPGNPAEVEIAGQKLRLFDSPPMHGFGFTPAFSLLVACDDADQVARLAEVLGEGGQVLMPLGRYDFSPCYAWVADPFGVSWQLMVEP
ncbi:VOC family protein [Paracoccus aminovorans]|uniref:VOC family protein n=1 Tax=Paracoccus aminovorans TaxID=34004 RepID=UPI002B25D5DB|nr:VOC family protein [Paracoccus aminovorans]